MKAEENSICPLCRIREKEWDSEPPGPGGYSSECSVCFSLSGTRYHTHTYYGSPAQVKAGTIKAGHSWRTTVSLNPLWEDGKHVGFRCRQFDECGWEQRFTPEEMELCDWDHKAHGGWSIEPTYKVLCARLRDHLFANGEVDERGHITEYGRQMEQRRSDADNWDPGKYIER